MPFSVWHLNPSGQQWTWSSQHTAFRKGQQPQAPDCRRQHVWPSGQLTSWSHCTSCTVWAGRLVIRAIALSRDKHLLCFRSHTVSWGQQCRWSEQQMALGIGQQPYSPLGSLQQVVSSGHWDRASGHRTEAGRAAERGAGDGRAPSPVPISLAPVRFLLRAGTFLARGWVPVGVTQRICTKSQAAPWGQQCTLSSQQEAWGMGQHPQEPSSMGQHVEESGHSNSPPGHWTAPSKWPPGLWVHVRPSALQWKPWGQQWRPPLQATACENGQQAEVPEVVRTQEWPAEQ